MTTVVSRTEILSYLDLIIVLIQQHLPFKINLITLIFNSLLQSLSRRGKKTKNLVDSEDFCGFTESSVCCKLLVHIYCRLHVVLFVSRETFTDTKTKSREMLLNSMI